MMFAGLTGGVALAGLLLSGLYSLEVLGQGSEGPTLVHWHWLLSQRSFWVALGYSLLLAALTLALALTAAFLLVLWLGPGLLDSRQGRLLYIPLAIPGTVAALVASLLLGDSGLLARIAHALGWIQQPAEFPSLVFDRLGVGIVLTHSAMITPFFIILFTRLIQSGRLAEYRQLALSLGATPAQSMWRVVLPLLWSGTLPVVGVYAAVLVGAYEVPLLIGARYPAMLSVEIQNLIGGYDLSARPRGYAMATLYLLLLFGAWMLAQRGRLRRSAAP